MGKKKQLKKLNPDRHKVIVQLREKRADYVYYMKNGAEVVLNPFKHFMLGKPYKNKEYENEMFRQVRKVQQSQQTNEES